MATVKQIVDAAMKPLGVEIEWEERKDITKDEIQTALDALNRLSCHYYLPATDVETIRAALQAALDNAGGV